MLLEIRVLVEMENLKSASTPLLFVFGIEHAEARRCITALVEKYADTVYDNASVETESPTEKCARHPFNLNGKVVALVDANRSIANIHADADSPCGEAFLSLLEETGKAPFYPPLVILNEPKEVDKTLLEHLRLVFPSLVCAVRCSKPFLATIEDDFSHSLSDVPLFHINEDVNKLEDKMSRVLRSEDLEKIYVHYSTLTPTRDELDFDLDLFEGDYERVKIRTERDSEDKEMEELVTRLEEQETKRRRVGTHNRSGYTKRWADMDQRERNLAFNFISQAIGSFLREEAWIPLSEEDVEPSQSVEMEAIYRRIYTLRSHFKRDVNDVYKVLHNGMRIYYGEVKDDWKVIGDEVIDKEYVRVPPS